MEFLMPGSLQAIVLLLVSFPVIQGLNTYVGDDGKSRFYSALSCTYQSFYYTFYYNVDRSQFTPRGDMDCCFLNDSRNYCCVNVPDQGSTEPGECRCDPSVECGILTTAPTTTTTTPTTTTTLTTTTTEPTTTTTVPTTTTTEPTTTTTTPTTTTTEPTTTTTEPTTTTTPTTTTPTTTAPFRSLCAGARVLNGDAVDDHCTYSGIANITSLDGLAFCSAVYTGATVNGEFRDVFLTAKGCTDLVASVPNLVFELQIGIQKLPISEPLISIVDGPDGNAFLDVDDRYRSLITELGCQTTACAYNGETMAGQVDFNDCKIISYGASEASLSVAGLNEVALILTPFSCENLQELADADGTMCFTSASGQNLRCSGDAGAPIYCKALPNNEDILMGVAAFDFNCDESPKILMLPFPN